MHMHIHPLRLRLFCTWAVLIFFTLLFYFMIVEGWKKPANQCYKCLLANEVAVVGRVTASRTQRTRPPLRNAALCNTIELLNKVDYLTKADCRTSSR